NDGALSVLRAFTRRDWTDLARSAGLPRPHVRWRWAFRWEVTFVRDAASSLGVAPVDERNEEARDA
ncbi:MAG TPA: hypothetical protein VK116_10505, partial [Planctomycetota bacterium]|nr:hypothetical protein [Planctomycetota bacterium]